MDIHLAIRRLSAIAQEGRLAAFRLLVRAGPEGMAAGDIARTLGVAANTLSAQLLVLSNAGLVRARREGRSIVYAVEFPAMRDLLVYLMRDCCAGRPEMCAPPDLQTTIRVQPKGAGHETPARARRGR